MKYKLVIFDFDGTLADTFPLVLKVGNEIADQYHIKPFEQAEIEMLRTRSVRQIIQQVKVPLWKVALLARAFRRGLSRHLSEIRLFEGMTQVIGELSSRGSALAIVSSNSPGTILHVLGPENASRISYTESRVSVITGKAGRIRKVLRSARVGANEAILIGDEIRDLDAARKAGVAFGAVSWGYTTPAALSALSPDFVFLDPVDIVRELSGK